MNCFSRLSSCILGRTSHFIAKGTPKASHQSRIPFWRRSFEQSGLHLEFLSTRFRIQCYSSRKPSLKASIRKKKDSQPTTVMDHEKDAFFVVRKGDVVGVYKNFADCEAQLGTSILDPPVSVYKGYSLSKDSEAYLVSHGLQNALYTITAADLKEDLFGMLIPCPFQIEGSWKAKHENITNLYEEAKKLKNSFLSFHISHVPREYNSEADSQANLAIRLADGEVQEEFE
ncbi:PREDICTED: uncharacterized protein LOC105126491 [Populus euphratica]|uniref:Uncharacterized protein LOC105126491 n=1 Tax=Populus euphratica TaxID=75702 RepID=A0AAJ6UAP6_POPEU|nr:PREDICTED: uncharacterized protein LOC105126491 [Populus euphratica]